MITPAEFARLVRDMRDAQKEYFRTRDIGVLQRSKRLERRVDDVVEDLATSDQAEQGRLFGGKS